MRPARATVAAAVLVLLTGGCSALDGAPDEVDRPVVALLGGAGGGPEEFESDDAAVRAALRADCEDCEYAAFDAEGDAAVQADQLDQALEGGADIVLLEAVDAESGEEMVASADDVPVITMDRVAPGADFHVGYDPRRTGRVLSRTAREAAAGTDAPGVLLLGAGTGDLAGSDLTTSTREALTDAGAEVLAEETPDVATVEAARTWISQQAVERPPDAVDLVVVADPVQAEGVAAAYDEAEVAMADRPVVVGPGGDLASLRRLISGDQAATTYLSGEAVARRAVATAAEILEGAQVTGAEERDGVPSFLGVPEPVTLRNLTTVMVREDVVTIGELCEGETEGACAELGIS